MTFGVDVSVRNIHLISVLVNLSLTMLPDCSPLFSRCRSQLLSEEVDKVSTPIGAACVCASVKAVLVLMIRFHLQAEHELRVAQTEFDRQAEVTRLLLEGISSTHVSQCCCLLSVSQQ